MNGAQHPTQTYSLAAVPSVVITCLLCHHMERHGFVGCAVRKRTMHFVLLRAAFCRVVAMTDTEEVVSNMWMRMLRCSVGLRDDFFEVGLSLGC